MHGSARMRLTPGAEQSLSRTLVRRQFTPCHARRSPSNTLICWAMQRCIRPQQHPSIC